MFFLVKAHLYKSTFELKFKQFELTAKYNEFPKSTFTT